MSALAPALDRRAQIYWRHVNELVFDGKKADSSRLHTFAAAHFETRQVAGQHEPELPTRAKVWGDRASE